MNGTGKSASNGAVSVPRYEIVDKRGIVCAIFADRTQAHAWARENMQGAQDSSGDGEEPNGWDVQIAGCE